MGYTGRMSMLRAEFDALAVADPDRLFALFAQYEAQAAQVVALTARVEQLERQVGGHSQNSHRPPASDGPRTPPRSARAQRQVRRRAAGASRAHPDHDRHPGRGGGTPPGAVRAVRGRLGGRAGPPLALVVTEHRAATVCCPHCRAATTAPFPAGVTGAAQYGPRVLGLGVSLRHDQLLPYRRVADLLADLFGRGPSPGTLHTAVLACAAALAPVALALADARAAAPLAHTDETSAMVAGQQQWVHVVCTARLTHDARHAQRGQAATAASGLLPRCTGRRIHDGWASYWHHPGAHGRCDAHHLRELTALAAQPGQGWAADRHALLRAMLRHVHQGRAAGRVASPPAECAAFVARYRAVLAQGYAATPPPTRSPDGPQVGRLKRTPARNLLDRLATHEAAVLACLHDWAVPCDNHQAARDLRMIKVQRQISGTCRDDSGADACCRIRSYLATLRTQAQQVLLALAQTLAGQPPLPCLLPAAPTGGR